MNEWSEEPSKKYEWKIISSYNEKMVLDTSIYNLFVVSSHNMKDWLVYQKETENVSVSISKCFSLHSIYQVNQTAKLHLCIAHAWILSKIETSQVQDDWSLKISIKLYHSIDECTIANEFFLTSIAQLHLQYLQWFDTQSVHDNDKGTQLNENQMQKANSINPFTIKKKMYTLVVSKL